MCFNYPTWFLSLSLSILFFILFLSQLFLIEVSRVFFLLQGSFFFYHLFELPLAPFPCFFVPLFPPSFSPPFLYSFHSPLFWSHFHSSSKSRSTELWISTYSFTRKARKKRGVGFGGARHLCPLRRLPILSFPELGPLNFDIDPVNRKKNDGEMDKLNPELGYRRGNVWTISRKANKIIHNYEAGLIVAVGNGMIAGGI